MKPIGWNLKLQDLEIAMPGRASLLFAVDNNSPPVTVYSLFVSRGWSSAKADRYTFSNSARRYPPRSVVCKP